MRMIPMEELRTLSQISDMCHNSQEPLLIKNEGCGDMVVMSVETYEKILNDDIIYRRLEMSEKDIAEGKTQDAKEVISIIREKYEI